MLKELINRLRKRGETQQRDNLYTVEKVLQRYAGSDNLKVTFDLPEKLPEVYTYKQLAGFPMGLTLAVIHLLGGCEVHAGRGAHVTIRATYDKDFQYIDIEDNGPGIKNLSELRQRVIVLGHGGHHMSSLDLACDSVKRLGGVIIPSNVEDNEGKIVGACFRIQIPLDQEKINNEHSQQLRQDVGKKLGLLA